VPTLDPSGLPATVSRPILTGLLRERLGYDGVIVTDSLEMQGAQIFGPDSPRRVPVEALKAGADMLLMPPNTAVAVNAVLDAVRAGELTEARIDQSVYRILRLKLRRGLFPLPYVNESKVGKVVGSSAHVEAADAITDKTVTLVRNQGSSLPLRGAGNILVAGWDATTATTLASELSRRGLTAEPLSTGTNPTQTTIDRAVAAAAGKDLVLVATNRAWTAGNAGQQRLVRALAGGPAPVVAVATRDPYDIAYFPEVDAYVASYGWHRAALGAVARVLTGEVNPTGKLPVSIPVAGQPGTTLYPFGHGLSYPRG
jgi:beta-N-acetylhexosaminidase